jgi:hypothetical protein
MSGGCVTRSVRLEVRRDVSSRWTTTNPVLRSGEPGYETDTGKLKIGNGTADWNTLSYYVGATGPTGPVGPAIEFDAGAPGSDYTGAAVFDMGSVS